MYLTRFSFHSVAHVFVRAAALGALIALPLAANAGQFKHQYLTLDLPSNWKNGPKPAGGKETIGQIQAKDMPGASIIIQCYRGGLHTRSSTRIRGLNLIAASLPGGNELVGKKKKVKTAGGKKLLIENWRGYVPIGGGKQVALAAPMATGKTKDCWLVMVGFVGEANGDKLNEEFLTIVKSAR